MQIENWPIDRVKQYEGNPRNNDAAVGPVAESIRQFGFKVPVLVDRDGVVIAGHTRLRAARQLGLTEVPVIQADDLTPEQVRAFRIADNQLATIATWNLELLPIELSELQMADVNLEVLGFSEDQLSKLIDTTPKDGLTDPDNVPEPPDEAITKPGDLWILGTHRLLCGDSANPEHVDRLLDGAKIQLAHCDPPYNVAVSPRSKNAIAAGNSTFASYGQPKTNPGEDAQGTPKKLRAKDRPLENDFISDEEFDRLLHAWFGNIARVLEPGRAFYAWGGYANLANYPAALAACDLYFSQAIVWNKLHPVLTRKDFMGAFELCQPPDTKVLTPSGETRIESLRDGDEVAAFAPRSWAIIGQRSGPRVKVGTRHYGGPLYGVSVEAKTTWCTDGHLFSVRLAHNAPSIWCVYLMRRGRWWRVGKTKLLTTWGLGLKQRLDMENGEEAWILSTHDLNSDAACAEQIVSARYGIPTTFWVESQTCKRTESQIAHIYDQIDPMALHRGALWALSDHHRRLEYPFIRQGRTGAKYGRRVSFLTRACNLLPGAMKVPAPTTGPSFCWVPIRHIDVQHYTGSVYSLDVEKYHHYIADGIVTHNCFYGWRKGAAHRYFGPNNATDLWEVKKVNPSKMIHLTEKPVELAVRAMQYSSRPDENVLDLFGGSGSTLIAAEQTGRKAFLMELDPLYCDVIVERFEKFTGRKAERTNYQEATS